MLASVGATLAVERINIAGLSLGSDKPGQRALTVINVDSPLTDEILESRSKSIATPPANSVLRGGQERHEDTNVCENFTFSLLFLCALVPLWQMMGFRPRF